MSEERRQSFGSSADAYDRTRPGYPEAAVRWAIGDPAESLVVCELGAGTGKLTRMLLDLGHRVVVVEPDARMLERLQRTFGDREGLLATHHAPAEHLPLDDRSVDAVVAGQAWHWFDQSRVGAEVGRVLRGEGGIAAALWYTLDRSVDWVDRWLHLVGVDTTPVGLAMLETDEPRFGDWAADVEHGVFDHRPAVMTADLVDLAASTSPVLARPQDEQRRILEEVADLVASHPDLAGDEVAMPYRIDAFRARRR